MSTTTERPRIVSSEEWLAERQQHLAEEKSFTRQRDRLSALRRGRDSTHPGIRRSYSASRSV